MNPLGALPSRGSVDVDLAFQRLIGSSQPQVTLTSPKQGLEHLGEVGLDSGKSLQKHGSCGPVDLTDGLNQRLPRADQIVPLSDQEIQALALFRMLFNRQRVDWADALQGGQDSCGLSLQ